MAQKGLVPRINGFGGHIAVDNIAINRGIILENYYVY
jgi:hypothetical protein